MSMLTKKGNFVLKKVQNPEKYLKKVLTEALLYVSIIKHVEKRAVVS